MDLAGSFFRKMLNKAKRNLLTDVDAERHSSSVSSRDVKLNMLYGEVMNNPSHMAHLELQDELNHRMRADHIFEMFSENSYNLSDDTFPLPRNFECLKAMVKHTEEKCGRFSDYSLKYVKYLVKECESIPAGAVDGLMHRISRICQ
jgi:hypothetical protein